MVFARQKFKQTKIQTSTASLLFAAAIYAGKLAAYWNLPHISFSSTNPELMDKTMFSTLVRVMSPFNHMATAIRHVFSFFGVSIIYILSPFMG